jgi:hypothetical protein
MINVERITDDVLPFLALKHLVLFNMDSRITKTFLDIPGK